MFCEKCGRILKDEEYRCPECGRICRDPPIEKMQYADFIRRDYDTGSCGTGCCGSGSCGPAQPLDPKFYSKKYFILALLAGLIIGMTVTYFWRFTLLIFCIPLFFPLGNRGVGMGLMMGMALGCLLAYLVGMFTITT